MSAPTHARTRRSRPLKARLASRSAFSTTRRRRPSSVSGQIRVAPASGTGYSVGGMSIVRPRTAEAQRFFEWALSPQGQKGGRHLTLVPVPIQPPDTGARGAPTRSGRQTDRLRPPEYGASAERKRLLNRWEKGLQPPFQLRLARLTVDFYHLSWGAATRLFGLSCNTPLHG